MVKNENIIRVRLTTIDEILGSQPNDKEIYSTYIASKAPDAPTMEQEIEAFGAVEVDEKGMTVFARNEDGAPCLYNYQIKGFFKAACQAFKKLIDQGIFVYADFDQPQGRYIPISFEGEMGICQRPLRASTPQGERVALASSESIPAGATLEFDIYCFNKSDLKLVREWLDYGRFNGLSQWRNSGKGAFIWEEVE